VRFQVARLLHSIATFRSDKGGDSNNRVHNRVVFSSCSFVLGFELVIELGRTPKKFEFLIQNQKRDWLSS
jgi:hypothetical protein